MRRILLALGMLAFCSAKAMSAPCAGIPYTFVNGTVADAAQVNANMSAILGCIATAGNVSSLFSSTPGSFAVYDNTLGTLVRDINTSTQVISVIANSPLEGIYGTGTGAKVSMCPGYAYGCPGGGAEILSMFAAVNETIGGPTKNESTIYAFMKSNTGEVHPWVPVTVYLVNGFVMNDSNLYQQTVASCTSDGAGGPTGTGTAIVDNTCRWNYKGPSYAAAKQGLNFILDAYPGSGSVWGAAGGAALRPGFNGYFATAAEIDLLNYSGRDPGFTNSMIGMYLGGPVGTQPIGTMLYIAKDQNGTVYGSHEGIWINGPYGNSDHDIRISTQHSQIGYFDEGAHAVSSIFDFSTSPVGLTLGGAYASSALDSNNIINVHRTIAGAPFNALLLSNVSSVASTQVNIQLGTGSAGSFGTLAVTDASQLGIFAGAGLVNGIGINASAGPLALITTASAAIQFYTTGLLRANFGPGGGLTLGAPTGSDKGPGTVNIENTIWTNGVQGIASQTCTVNTASALTLIFTNGLLTGGSCNI